MAKSYLTRITHFTFYKEGDELVVQSERDDVFEVRHDWPDGWSVRDEDLFEKLHENYYIEMWKKFQGPEYRDDN
jgi:hypothetical protein